MGFVLFCILALLSAHVTHFAHGNSSNATIRLADGSSSCEGRVEVLYNGSWGTICDDMWDDTDAAVVCRALGLGDRGFASCCATFGQGSGEIILDNVQCVGSETDLFSCPSNGPLNHDCAHFEDAAVLCCNTQTKIRLADGSLTCEGRVEVLYNGSWGTVCDDFWDDTNAAVVCRILGLGPSGGSTPLAAASYGIYGQGSGEIVLDNVQCVGTETDLFSCPSNGPLNHNCQHSEDAGVFCCNTQSLRIRLADGSSSNEGRVEALFNGQWGTVCDHSWDLNDANVVCQSLGLGHALEAVSNAGFGEGTGIIILDDVGCLGRETNIFDCIHSGFGIHNCHHYEDAGVRCFPNSSESWMRLADGSSSNEGRVEIFYNGQWGTVCDDSWDLNDANAVCYSLGLGHALEAVSNAGFGEGTGMIVLGNVACTGIETNILLCARDGIGNHGCTHSEDVGVRCYLNSSESWLCLANGSSSNEGRVEIFYNGQWGTVCDDWWDLNDANVVCQSLGLGPALEAVLDARFGEGTGMIVLDNVRCTGSETNIFQCGNSGLGISNCHHFEDAGVRCSRNASESSSICPKTQSQKTTEASTTTPTSPSTQPHTTTQAPTTTQTTATTHSQTATQTTATTPAQTTTQTTATTPTHATTQTKATTPTQSTKQAMATTQAQTSVSTTLTKDTFGRSKIFRRVAIDKALSNAYSSHQVVSVISCSHLCLADESCKYFTYIEHKRECLLGQSLTTTEFLNGASTYSS